MELVLHALRADIAQPGLLDGGSFGVVAAIVVAVVAVASFFIFKRRK